MDATNKTFIGVIAEQIYKDSNEFTYRESGDMYKSGELLSKFNQGIITERTLTQGVDTMKVEKQGQGTLKHNLDGLKKPLLNIEKTIVSNGVKYSNK